MRTLWLLGAAVLALFAVPSAAPSDEPPKVNDFFDGQTLEGWEGQPGWWSVQDGAIVGTYTNSLLKHNTFLWSKKKYKDFEMHFQIRLKDGVGNSGVQVRSFILDPDQYTRLRAAVRHRPEVLGQPLRREFRRHDEAGGLERGRQGA